jgi:hypothetical protein
MRVLSVVFVLWVSGSGAAAQQSDIPAAVRAAAERITATQLARDVEYLSADALLGRNTPSPGFDSAAAYIARRLQRAGLQPLGDSGTYFQHYELREERVDTAAAYLEIGGQRFRFGDDFVMRSFAGPITGVLPVVYVGHGWSVPGRGIDPYAAVDVRGKLVLAQAQPPAGLELQQIGRITVGATPPLLEAQRRGAAGVIYIAQAGALAAWDGSRRTNTARLELHPIVPSAYAAAPLTSTAIRPNVAEVLLAGERVAGGTALARGDSAVRPQAVQLEKQITVHVPLTERAVHRPYNVVAMLEGSDPLLKNEFITIESHLDGAVGRASQNGDSIYNAADDNATGSAASLAIAEQMMTTRRPKRSLIFIWDSGEERGLWGTRHFVHAPPVPLDSIVAHFNIDMIGANRAPGSADSASADVTGPNEVYLVGPGVLSTGVDSLLERVNRSFLNLRFNRSYDRADNQFFYPRTDAGPFLERGVLTIGFFTGIHDRYHGPRDEARYLDPKKMESIARTVFVSAWMLADSRERPRIDREIPASVPRYR